MRNQEAWRPSVFVQRRNRWTASRQPRAVSPASRVQVAQAAPAYAAAIARYAAGALLDLGCGKVPCYLMYKGHVRTITCTDWPRSHHGNEHLDFFADVNRPLPVRDRTFDTVLMTDVLEHLAYPDGVFAEVRRVLRPGGTYSWEFPSCTGCMKSPVTSIAIRDGVSSASVTTMVFRVVNVEAYGSGLSVMADLGCKLLGRCRWTAPLVPAVSRLAVGATAARHSRTDTTMPAGYVLVATVKGSDAA